MSTVELKEAPDVFQAHYDRLKQQAGGEPAWLSALRKSAFDRFNELGYPTTKDEEWRFTNVAPIAGTPFAASIAGEANVSADALSPYVFDQTAATLVFVNGWFSASLSSMGTLPKGVRVLPLSEVLADEPSLVQAHLAQHADGKDQAFAALSAAMMQDGAVVILPDGAVIEQPIHLVFAATDTAEPFAAHPRNLIVMGVNTQATVVESFVGLGGGTYLTNTVMEIIAGESAVLDHYKVVRESDSAFHMSALQISQDKSSNVTSHVISLGGGLVRNDMHTTLDAEGCECTLNGLSMLSGERLVDNHLIVDHAKPHCRSWEYFKSVLDDKGRSIFSGRINVREDAQKTDAKQTNMSLLMSKDAQVESKPQLEIFANDVKCTHGATIGQIDEEAIFYLRSRGICETAARSLLVYAFARENVDKIRVAPLKAALDELLFARLPGGELLREVL